MTQQLGATVVDHRLPCAARRAVCGDVIADRLVDALNLPLRCESLPIRELRSSRQLGAGTFARDINRTPVLSDGKCLARGIR
jgi:hypothetical protein